MSLSGFIIVAYLVVRDAVYHVLSYGSGSVTVCGEYEPPPVCLLV